MPKYAINEPINQLIIAVNQYVSTGDDIGFGACMPTDASHTMLVIPYDPDIRSMLRIFTD